MSLTESTIVALAPNATAVSNGRGLVSKNKFTKLCKTADETLLFGECSGSGSKPYSVSVDLAHPETPTFRCSCPSRQFPCKHAVGLMLAFAQGKSFTVEALPDDISEKRAKKEKREERKAESDASDAPKKPAKKNTSALKKKIEAQISGLSLAETLALNMISDGFGALNKKTTRELDQQAKQLGDSYLPGVQARVRDLLALYETTDAPDHVEAFHRLSALYTLCKRGREYLESKRDHPELADTKTPIESWLGTAWQLSDLEAAGLTSANAELLQLCFYCHDDQGAQSYEDVGIWIDLQKGDLLQTNNIRPYKAAKYIRQEDSIFDVLLTPVLCHYPGQFTPRVRYDAFTLRRPTSDDYQRALLMAQDLAIALKAAREQLKNPLEDRHAYAWIKLKTLGCIGDTWVLEDAQGQRIELTNEPTPELPPPLPLLEALGEGWKRYQAALLRFSIQDNRLMAHPLSLLSECEILRLAY